MKKLRQIYFKNLKELLKTLLAIIIILVVFVFTITTIVLFVAFSGNYPIQSCLSFFGGWSFIILSFNLIKIFIESYKEYKDQNEKTK